MESKPTAEKLRELEAQIAALQQKIGTLTPDKIGAAAAQLVDFTKQRDTMQAELSGDGIIVQGSEHQVVAHDSIGVGRDAEVVIRGDNNSVNYLMQQVALPQLDAEALRREIGKYLSWVQERSGTLELRGIKREGQQVVQLDLHTVYVPLEATVTLRPEADREMIADMPQQQMRQLAEAAQERDIALNEVLGLGTRLVITGGPGCGKTTVLMHLAWALSRAVIKDDTDLAQTQLGLNAPLPLPIFIPLSAYAAYRRTLPRQAKPEERTLANFISRYLIEHQSSFDLPADFFKQLLRQGQGVLLLLDGLDEVPDDGDRAQVREAIEELCIGGRNGLRVVVTCRSAAYKERTALGKGFQEIRVQPLSETHINALITQAYAAIYRNDPKLRDDKAKELLDGIQRLESERQQRLGEESERLVSSPLLVRMLIIVHFSERRLPEQRAELYMKATDAMLLPGYNPDQEIAEQIGRLVGGSQERHRDLVQYLAYQMHHKGGDQGREIHEWDLRRLLEKEKSYQPLADDFLALTKLRGTVLEERLGTYRFIHLGFQEFLAARYLAEVVGRKEGLPGLVAHLEAGLVLKPWWREPVLLLVGYLSVTASSVATDLLRWLAGLARPASLPTPPPAVQIAAAELAGTAAWEWSDVDSTLQRELADQLAAHMKNEAVLVQAEPVARAALGVALAHLGDPRLEMADVDQMPFHYVPPGDFYMGDGKEMQLQPCLDYGYWLARWPVTYAQYGRFMHDGGYDDPDYWPEAINHGVWQNRQVEGFFGGKRRQPAFAGLPNQPVRGLTWYEALAFTRWLNRRWHGLVPAGWQVHLPTEAEWEKGARGGIHLPTVTTEWTAKAGVLPTSTVAAAGDNPLPLRVYPWGDAADSGYANGKESGIGEISSLGCFPQGNTPYELAEMAGNVFEWTRTVYVKGRYVPDAQRENLAAGKRDDRVLRGGSFGSDMQWQRCGARDLIFPLGVINDLGFRIVLSPLFDSGF